MPTTTSDVDATLDRLRQQVDEAGVWFVDIPRTGSTSLKVELGRALGAAYGKANTADESLRTAQLVTDHLSAQTVRDLLGADLWARTFTFTFVRDPWTRTESMYRWRRREGSVPADLSLSDYVDRLAAGDQQLFAYPPHFAPCAAYVTDERGRPMVDFVGRFDRRAEDLQLLQDRLPGVSLGRVHTQQGDQQVAVGWTDRTAALVGQLYEKDVRLFRFTVPDHLPSA